MEKVEQSSRVLRLFQAYLAVNMQTTQVRQFVESPPLTTSTFIRSAVPLIKGHTQVPK